MSQQLENGLLIAGMAIVFLLIIGVIGALRGRKATAPVPAWADAEGVDLEDRLRKITLSALKPAEEPALTPAANPRLDSVAAPERPAPSRPATGGLRGDGVDHGGRPAPPPRVAETPTQPTTRLALPGSGTVRPSDFSTPTAANPGEGLNPLAARFGTLNSPGSMATPAPPEPLAPKRFELPGTVARDLGIPGFGTDEAGSNPFAGLPASPPSTRLSLPGAVAGGFIEMPSTDFPSIRPSVQPSLPPTESTLRREAFDPPAARRPELPGELAASGSAGPAMNSPSMLDIRAILRGDSAPAPAALPSSGFVIEPPAAPRKPTFTTGPLPPSVEQGAPMGAVPFDPNLLRVREPVPIRIEPPKIAASSFGAPTEFSGPASYESTGNERIASNGRLLDLDATRLVEDFDLPDTGFETHVFSTAELVEGEPLGFPSFPGEMPEIEPPPAPSPAPITPIRAAGTAARTALTLSSLQEDQVRGHVAELAGLVDVVFARLIGADGSVILSTEHEEGDAALESDIASLVKMAAMEVQQLDLGDWQTLSVEAAGTALLLSPVHAHASLAVLLGNPTRLGLLRRQVRKPLAALRTILAESSVS